MWKFRTWKFWWWKWPGWWSIRSSLLLFQQIVWETHRYNQNTKRLKKVVVISMNIMRGTQKHHNYLLTYENWKGYLSIYTGNLETSNGCSSAAVGSTRCFRGPRKLPWFICGLCCQTWFAPATARTPTTAAAASEWWTVMEEMRTREIRASNV